MLWTNLSVLELVDAAIPDEDLGPIKQTILQVQGVQVGIGILFCKPSSFQNFFGHLFSVHYSFRFFRLLS